MQQTKVPEQDVIEVHKTSLLASSEELLIVALRSLTFARITAPNIKMYGDICSTLNQKHVFELVPVPNLLLKSSNHEI